LPFASQKRRCLSLLSIVKWDFLLTVAAVGESQIEKGLGKSCFQGMPSQANQLSAQLNIVLRNDNLGKKE